ncbi:MAG: hypothetical protein EBQ96_01570 [Proteobacteria bacterium]|nr:hypothetical protein [Pseudomonadota bacterium]
MLTSMREGAGAHVLKFVALGFVLMGVGGMVFMDVGGFFRGGVTDTTLARIGGTEISLQSFERTAAPALRSQNMNMQEAYRFGVLQNILDEMVARETMRQEAIREGLIIGKTDIAGRVHDFIKTQIQPGETAQQAFERVLSTQGLTEADIVSSMRQSLTSQMVDGSLKSAVAFVPKLATEALGRFQAERRDIVFVTLTPEIAGKDINADDEALKNYYETVKDQYQIPEQRTFKALTLNADEIKSTITVTDEDVKAAYAERKDQFRVEERRKIEQVVLADEAKAKEAAAEGTKKKSLKGIADKSAYRDASDVEKTGLPTELAAPVFEAAKGTVLNPIKTALGWHVIRVIDVVPARTQTFDEIKADLKKELESDALHTEMESRIAKIDEAIGRGDAIDEVASTLGSTVTTVGPIDVKGNFVATDKADPLLTALAQNKDLLASLFELMEGETADLTEINETMYAVFALESITPTRDRDFAEVRSELLEKWTEEQRATALTTLVDKLTGELNRKEKTFEEAAKEAGVVVKTARDVSRESKVAGINDPVALTRLFDETDLSAIVKVPTGTNVILAKVLDARIPEAGMGKATPETEKQWRIQSEQAIASLFTSDLRKRHDVKVNTKLLERMYGAKADEQP